MSSKNLTYYQFKKIASALGDKINDPREVANVSGLTDIDYDILHEYLIKWQQEKELEQNQPEVTEKKSDNFESLEKKSLMALFRSTLESSNDGIIIIDNNGKLIDWNDKFFEIAKIPQEALEHASEEVGLEHIFNQVKDPQKLMIELGRLEEENSMKGDFGEVEFLDGRTIERYTQPLILDNKPVGRVWCFKDITEEKAQKDRVNILTRAIQSATQGILVLDNDSVVYINDYLRLTLEMEQFDINNSKIININNNKLNKLYRKICQQLEITSSGKADNLQKSERQFEIKGDTNNSKWYELSTFISEYNEKKIYFMYC